MKRAREEKLRLRVGKKKRKYKDIKNMNGKYNTEVIKVMGGDLL
jgi:hypothetical protein